MITLGDYLIVSGLLFIISFMCLELMLNAANLSLVAFSRFRVDAGLPNYHAQVFVFFIITVAAAEVAVGLAIIVALSRARQPMPVDDIARWKFLFCDRQQHRLVRFVRATDRIGVDRGFYAPVKRAEQLFVLRGRACELCRCLPDFRAKRRRGSRPELD